MQSTKPINHLQIHNCTDTIFILFIKRCIYLFSLMLTKNCLSIKNVNTMVWRNYSVVSNTYCYCGGPKVNILAPTWQHAAFFLTPVTKDPTLASGIWHEVPTWYTYIHSVTKLIHIKSINNEVSYWLIVLHYRKPGINPWK